MNIILLGAPGAGKGTQARLISERIGAPPISTGKIIRAAIQSGTPAGLAAKALVDAGKLVPDDVVIAMLRERIAENDCKNGYILDGFPRNVHQAEALAKMGVVIDLVIDIEVADAQVEERLCGRRICGKCNAPYHVIYSPSSEGEYCEVCDGALIIREDDKPEIVRERLRIYHAETEPLMQYYREAGLLRQVTGQEKVEDTAAQVVELLGAFTR
ncbi:MAG: adenylate kinase [Oscillospiraceae bacterium]|nr:adenylate kinase [Oscillospiraceae bacterium]